MNTNAVSKDWINGYTWGYRLMWAVFALSFITACTQTVYVDTADTVCDEWREVLPTYERSEDSEQTIAEVQRNQDIFIAICEEGDIK